MAVFERRTREQERKGQENRKQDEDKKGIKEDGVPLSQLGLSV